MKVTIEYDGNEEQEDLHLALDGYKWKNAMWELDQHLRRTTKYQSSVLDFADVATETEIMVVESIRESIGRILSGYNLKLD